MPVRIVSVCGTSRFFKPGDEIISIDSRPVEDQLDLLYLTQKEGTARFAIKRSSGRMIDKTISIASLEKAGLEYEEMEFMTCRSRCTFCFVDQMPPGLRPSLYVKDDDYRLSFLYGNYITLNDIGAREIEKIIELRLSPLYISVHAVDRELREHLFGRAMRTDIISMMRRLARGGIEMHAQVVLIPGINDGSALDRTIDSLFALYPACRSVAVVPVGLTRHRAHLERLRPCREDEARAVIDWAEERRRAFARSTDGVRFLHLSDEFYLRARRALPPEDAYEGFPQLANGVGMCRLFIKDAKRDIERLRKLEIPDTIMTVATGSIGGRFLNRYILPMIAQRCPRLKIELLVVNNKLFGRSVGVTGLISGADIIRNVKRRGGVSGCLVIPPNAINHEGLLIDDFTPKRLARTLGVPVLVPRETFLERRIVRGCGGGGRR
jgi:putative radical SAM enzyme (TIGR03279 family)